MILSARFCRASAVLALCLATAGCGDRISGWFSQPEADSLEPEGGYSPAVVDSRGLVANVTGMRVENTPGGAIVYATGLPPTQEFWDVDLVRIEGDDIPASELRYEFRVRAPVGEAAIGTQESRDLEAAAFATNLDLRGIRRITVIGQENSRSAAR